MIIITCWSVSLAWWNSSLGTTAARGENISAGTCNTFNHSQISKHLKGNLQQKSFQLFTNVLYLNILKGTFPSVGLRLSSTRDAARGYQMFTPPVRGPSHWGWPLQTFPLLCNFRRETPAALWRARLCRGEVLSGGKLLSPEWLSDQWNGRYTSKKVLPTNLAAQKTGR